jgi:hypothetical protein
MSSAYLWCTARLCHSHLYSCKVVLDCPKLSKQHICMKLHKLACVRQLSLPHLLLPIIKTNYKNWIASNNYLVKQNLSDHQRIISIGHDIMDLWLRKTVHLCICCLTLFLFYRKTDTFFYLGMAECRFLCLCLANYKSVAICYSTVWSTHLQSSDWPLYLKAALNYHSGQNWNGRLWGKLPPTPACLDMCRGGSGEVYFLAKFS